MTHKPAPKIRSRVLAIDPGFGRLGYAVLEENGSSQKIIEAGCVETSAGDPYGKRLLKIAGEIKKIIRKHRPQKMAIEKIFFTQNKKTAIQIAEVKGLIMYLALNSGIAVSEFTPLEVKMAVCGYGKADKTQVSRMLRAILKMPSLPKLDDTTDAIAVGLTYFAKRKGL